MKNNPYNFGNDPYVFSDPLNERNDPQIYGSNITMDDFLVKFIL